MRRLAVTVLCAVLGCGGGSIPYENVNDELVKAVCAKYSQCGAFSSESNCLALYANLTLSDYSAAISSGKIKYDGAAARTCVNAYGSASCESLFGSGEESCRHVYEGTAQVGASCGSTTECVPSAYCSPQTGGMMCSGTCTARVPEGGTATSSTWCEEGLRLVSGKCAKGGVEGAGCSPTAPCSEELACGSAMTCRKLGAEGAACNSTDRCNYLYTCVGGTCRKLLDVGESCASTDAGTPQCKLDLRCESPMKTCQERGGEGASCTSSSACKSPLGCSASGTCRNPVGEGQSCTDLPCDSATYCESMTKLCKKRVAIGQPCTSGTECESNSYCSSGKCTGFTTLCP